MKNDTREHCMHRDTSNACSIKRNVPRECLYAFIREGSMRASCTIPWILTYHLPCGRILGAIICFDRDSSFLGKSWSRLMILDEVGSKKERKKGEKISFSSRLKKKKLEQRISILDYWFMIARRNFIFLIATLCHKWKNWSSGCSNCINIGGWTCLIYRCVERLKYSFFSIYSKWNLGMEISEKIRGFVSFVYIYIYI